MKKLVAILGLLFSCPALAAVTTDSGFPVQTTFSFATTTVMTSAAFSTSTSPSTIVAVWTWCENGTTAPGTSAASGGGLSWTKVVELYGTGSKICGASMWVASSFANLSNATATLTTNSIDRDGQVVIYSLLGSDSTFGTTGTRIGPSGNEPWEISITPAATGNTIIGGAASDAGGNGTTDGNTTMDFNFGPGAPGTRAGVWHLTSMNTATSATATGSTGNAANTTLASIAAEIKAGTLGGGGGGDGGTTTPSRMTRGYGP